MKKIKFVYATLYFISFLSYNIIAQRTFLESKYPIIPSPQNIIYGAEEVKFRGFNLDWNEFLNENELLKNFFEEHGLPLDKEGIKIQLVKKEIAENNSKEAYKIIINKNITIVANSKNGAFYAVQTLKQLLRIEKNMGVFPQLTITDWPAFEIRGFMHDTGRNFQSIKQLKEIIDIASFYKYNTFHWHLTDNPAWRLESKLYPELQSDHAISRGKGDFYSQVDFKEIIEYCKSKNIIVIPEFDIPGHTEAFRKAINVDSMADKKVLPILLDLFNELCSLADAETMPFIHIGTDEVRNKAERISDKVILDIIYLLKNNNREVLVWEEGIKLKEDSTSIGQLWAQHLPRVGHRFIDSRANYVNHLDPFAGMTRLFFQQPTRKSKGTKLALGGILCVWPDDKVSTEKNILKHNPVFPSMVFYADAIWKGKEKNYPEYWSNLPPINSQEYKDFTTFEDKVITHRNLFFKEKDFPYIKQTNIFWKVIGPFNHQDNVNKVFPVEGQLSKAYSIDGNEFKWSESLGGATIHLKHFFGFQALTTKKEGTFYAYTNVFSPEKRTQDFWVGFQGWSRSGGRRGGPFPEQGLWHTTNPKIWVNNKEIAPPIWKQPGVGEKSDEVPFIDEDYFYREPTKIELKKGWNKILLKIPQGGNSWKWMFTCVPVEITDKGVNEVSGLKFDPTLRIYSEYYHTKKFEFEEETDTKDEIIFLGNSITDGGNWKELFPKVNAINRGISGDITVSVFDRLDEVVSSKPKKVFILIGTNDLAKGKSVAFVAQNIEKIIRKIQRDSPKTEIYLQSVLPINPAVGNNFGGHKSNGSKIRELNKMLENLSRKNNIYYVDIHSPFSDKNGYLKEKFTQDGLHLSDKGYMKWKRTIKQLVRN